MYSTPPPKSSATVLPDATSKLSKKEQVATMFNDIAPKYDFLNHFLSLGIDKIWRKKAIYELRLANPKIILDVATGTGDMAIAATLATDAKVEATDIAAEMMAVGKLKIKNKNYAHKINFSIADSAQLPFPNQYFDAVMCAYGVRNFEFLEKGLMEMNRVMKADGKLIILEFSKPTAFPIKQAYTFYFKNILPLIGKLFSKHRTAYQYLNASAMVFPDGVAFAQILSQCGFSDIDIKPLTFGVTTLYTARKQV